MPGRTMKGGGEGGGEAQCAVVRCRWVADNGGGESRGKKKKEFMTVITSFEEKRNGAI